jgi:hypothetical protein
VAKNRRYRWRGDEEPVAKRPKRRRKVFPAKGLPAEGKWPPTERQLAFLRSLCTSLGRPYIIPPNRKAARTEIALLIVKRDATLLATPEPAPTTSQLHDLAVLRRRAGEPSIELLTKGEASAELARLRQLTAGLGTPRSKPTTQ